MAQITYANKVAINENPEIADINKVKDTDLNEIKNVVNTNETKELLAVSNTAPAECSTGDMYFDTTDNLIYTATATDTWSSTGETPTESTIYVVIDDKVMYMYNGSTLVKLGSADIPQQDTAPSNPKEDDLWIDTDDNTNLVGVVGSTTISDKDTYSCNYLNQHLYDMYSTNEVLTNKIWIDGRPVYRKVYTGTITSISGLEIGSISNFGNLVHIEGWSNQNGYITSLLQYWDENLKSILQVGYQNGKVYLNTGGSFLNTDYTIIMEYTKTTDSGDR